MSVIDSISDRALPHSLDAERLLLGAVIVDPETWSEVAAVLTPDDWFRDAHKRIAKAMARLRDRGVPIDPMLLRDELLRTGELDEVGGPSYLHSLTDGMPRKANVAYYAAIVREKAKLRSTIVAGSGMISRAYDAEDRAADIVDAGVRDLLKLADARESGVVAVGEAVQEYVKTFDEAAGELIPSGLTDLDEIVGGFGRRKLTIIAARPSVGKSSFALCAADAAAASGIPTAVITLEMDAQALAGNLIAVHSGQSTERVRRKFVSEAGWVRISQAIGELQDRPLYFVSDAMTLTQVAAWTHRLKEQYGVQQVFIDYLQLMGDFNAKDRQREVAGISSGLLRIAKDQDVAIIALSQLSREPERRQDKRPHLADLRESGSLEQDAHLVLLLYREEMHKPAEENEGIAEVIVAKNRSGPCGTVKVCFIKELTRFTNLALY